MIETKTDLNIDYYVTVAINYLGNLPLISFCDDAFNNIDTYMKTNSEIKCFDYSKDTIRQGLCIAENIIRADGNSYPLSEISIAEALVILINYKIK